MFKYFVKSTPTASKSGYEFKAQHSFEKRKDESTRIKEKYPDKIPIIIERGDISDLPNMDKQKILIQKDLTIGQFLFIVRKKINIDSTQALFLFINNTHIPSSNSTIAEAYNKHMDKDGFLYITYNSQQAFGC